jgi:ribonuclease HI
MLSKNSDPVVELQPAMKTIQRIYTDGACTGNPGPGGWGTVVYFEDGSVHEMGGGDAATTNNRMEMQAAIAALEFLNASGQVEPVSLYTDSEYLKNGITKWIHGWQKKGWKTAAGKPVLNQDLWQKIDRLNSRQVIWEYVRGHSGDPGNERCDQIARSFAKGQAPKLQTISLPTQEASSNLATSTAQADAIAVQSNVIPDEVGSLENMTDPVAAAATDSTEDLPQEVRVSQLRNLLDTLHMADEISRQGYLITSAELADLMDVNASAVTSRGDNWVWRNWMVSRVRREGNQILWQLERVD